MPQSRDLSELVGRTAAVAARRAKIERLIEIGVLTRPLYPDGVILALVPIDPAGIDIAGQWPRSFGPDNVVGGASGDDTGVDVRFRDQLVESHGALVHAISGYDVEHPARGEHATSRAIRIPGGGIEHHALL